MLFCRLSPLSVGVKPVESTTWRESPEPRRLMVLSVTVASVTVPALWPFPPLPIIMDGWPWL